MSLQKEFVETTQQPAKQQMEAEYSRSCRHPHDVPAHILGYLGEKISSGPCTIDSKTEVTEKII